MNWDFSDAKVGKIINVQAYKHNGFLYRQWNGAKIIFNNKRHIVLFLKGTRVSESSKETSGWRYTESALWFIPKHEMFNSIVLFKKNVGSYYYINLTSLPIFEDNTIKFIDYDIDIKSYPGKSVQIVDHDEFEMNSKMMKYPFALKKEIFANVHKIYDLYNQKQYFFKHEIIQFYLEVAVQDKLITHRAMKDYISIDSKPYNEEDEIFLQNNLNKQNFKKFKNLKNGNTKKHTLSK
ncbi:DUF402 domain-containing protein [Mycoplasmopsis gallopavonis]|uniref:Protein of uncharacterized function (DUF402) n=1 Tax=Mycoplasmopsis gallopavonis TaxID=76629 RepID=A0A449AYV3_9BACT|nr:DUF402 domain-containing protein [Mycoplasmopsis gallopavonis]RIV16686.1 DUF402 domain-containing protein [Mycoplasmopsis gallopavonis]VEU72655.1 Protein of uncharacterised function (DUF402) [Mycoplasmopsis gallopavonis]